MTRHPHLLRCLLTMISVATFTGCAISPVGVRRMSAVDVHRSMTANALTEDKPSLDSRNVLHQRGLYEHFEKNPVWTLAELRRAAITEDLDDLWFTLAELSFLHAEPTHDRKYSAMAAIYAWAYLFGGKHPVEPFDPRLRTATDLYNRGITQGLEQGHKRQLFLLTQTVELPIGDVSVDFDAQSLIWNGRRLQDFVPVAELEVTGLNSRFRTPGLGAPLAASAVAIPPASSEDMLAPKLRTPVTALVRIPNSRQQIANGHIRATLEFYTDPNEETVEIEGQKVPLEKEPTAALASMVAEAPVIKTEIAAFSARSL